MFFLPGKHFRFFWAVASVLGIQAQNFGQPCSRAGVSLEPQGVFAGLCEIPTPQATLLLLFFFFPITFLSG